jgi:hypothetical protein
MDLSGLESAETIDMKEVRQRLFRIVWDHFGMVSSLGCSRIVPAYQLDPIFTLRTQPSLAYTRSYIVTNI